MKSGFQKFLETERTGIFELETVSEFFELKKLKKGAHFLQEGELCRHVAFIEKGLVLYYKIDDKGQEIICDFAQESDWITQYESFINQRASPLSIQALEDTELQIISYDRLNQLYTKVPVFEAVTRKIIEKVFIASLTRNNELQVLKAEERYAKFAQENPELIQRVPQYHIASYLGIAPQSLSRIRKNFMG